MGEKNQMKKATATSVSVAGTRPDGSYATVVNARVTYRNAPIHLLEKFSFKDVDAAHEQFLKSGFKECVILQTCNRVEVFAAAKDIRSPSICEQWSKVVDISQSELAAVEIETGKDAVVHLMKLAAGLDSLVVGEDQILGQVRRAFEYSKGKKYVGSNLSVAFDRALKV
ncbi:MAG TPA: hypothetical protein VJ742_10400, partial [Nitrososphaera sp.]|nr:hypothetical protein [Nitrososphaera sp.]